MGHHKKSKAKNQQKSGKEVETKEKAKMGETGQIRRQKLITYTKHDRDNTIPKIKVM